MQAWMRSLRYWGRNTEKMFLALLGCDLLWAFLFARNLSGNYMTNVVNLLVTYLMMLGVVFSFSSQISLTKMLLSVSVSFSSCRKYCILGQQWGNFMMTAQIMILVVIGKGAREGFANVNWRQMLMLLLAFLAANAVGQLSAALCVKLGSKGGTIVFLSTVLVVVLCSALTTVGITESFGKAGAFIIRLVTGSFPAGTLLLMALFCCLLYGVSVVVMEFTVGNYEVWG